MNQPDRLFDLLPAVYRQRDSERGFPLRSLLQVIAEQVDVVEADIARLYENWFIETCEDWVVPYLGDLIGYRQVHEAGEPDSPGTPQGRGLNKILIPRREMARTIQYRRRKGALALLEILANDVAGWPARAVEFYKLLGWTQHLNHQRPNRGRTVDLRHAKELDELDGPFDELAHTVDVRRTNSHRTMGRFNIPSVGVFVWRLKSYSVGWTSAEGNLWESPLGTTAASCIEEEGPHCYTFSVLGNDTPLYNRPQPETDPTDIAGEFNLPTPIRRKAFAKRVAGGPPDALEASDIYYGARKSVSIWAPDWPRKGAEQPIPANLIIPADLSGWRHHAPRNHVALDPERGRMVFPATKLPKQGVRVIYHYAFSADIGGGEYQRPLSHPTGATFYHVAQGTPTGTKGWFESVKAALDQWTRDKQSSSQPGTETSESQLRSAVIEIADSAVYTDPLNLRLQSKESLQIRAANRTRPVIRLLDYMADMPDALSITGDTGSRLTLDGLLITGRGIQVSGSEIDPESKEPPPGDLCSVTIRHCTLVPGWALHCDCEPQRETEPSLTLLNTRAHIRIEHSIIGAIEVSASENTGEPVCIDVRDSIWDATSEEREALSGPDDQTAYSSLKVARSTVLGRVLAHAIPLAENSLFSGLVRVARRQNGCMRFCYVPPDSRTPRRYECQPDLVDRAVVERLAPGSQRDRARKDERLRVEPAFNSTRYGTPTYCQLAGTCADEIKRGADDESEMGASHDLYQPQRDANLRARLDEFTPAGINAGVFYVA